MWKRLLLVFATIATASGAFAADKVKVKQGVPAMGKITKISPDEIVVEQGPITKNVPVSDILTVEFEGEPAELTTLVRNAYESGRFADALATLNKIDTAEIERDEIKQEIAFYKAACAAQLALGGSGSPQDAGRLLVAFESKESNSFHNWEICQLLGDLLVATGRSDAAQKYYEKLASSALPEYKLKAGLLVGRSLESQKEYEKAIAKYDEVIAGDGDSKVAASQKLAATCGKASAMAASGKADEAIKMVQEVIDKSEQGDTELHARAYNALGSCYRSAGKRKEALIAYLHTDLLFSNSPDQHAEALAALSTLWAESDKLDRAAEAKSMLKDRYPASRWAQQK